LRRRIRQVLGTRAVRSITMALLLCGSGEFLPAQAPTSPPARSSTAVGSIKGVAYDSLLMKPMVDVQVQLQPLNQSTRTNARGQFEFNRIPTGAHQLSLSALELDSLGFGTIGIEANVIEGKTANVTIGPPSLRTIWNRNCYAGNIVGKDSGVVWGTIRDAETQRELGDAAATFNWYDLGSAGLSGILVREVSEQAGTNAQGVYFACGLPSDVAIASEGITTNAASGRIDYALGARRMQRLDLTVSREMIIADGLPDDSATLQRASATGQPQGTAIVRGRVLNESNRPVGNAIVGVVNVDTIVRTDSTGYFRIAGLPAGSQSLSVRRVGSPPAIRIVHLRPGQTVDIDVPMSSMNTLTTVNVRAERSMSRDRIGFEQRKKNAFVRVREGDVFQKRADMYSVLDNMSRLRMTRNGFGLDIKIRRVGRGECVPHAFLDGFPSDINTASSLPIDLYRAVEVYENPYVVPAEFTPIGSEICGTILFWTKRIKW
jgi:hypothetical protein